MDALLDIKNVTMRFGSLVANDHVSLSCGYGSVISLLGKIVPEKPPSRRSSIV